MNTLTRIYKYALSPTPMQQAQLDEAGRLSRFLWNRLVSTTRFAQHEIEIGRRSTIENNYANFLKSKKMVGQRITAIKKFAEEKNITFEEALPMFDASKFAKHTNIVRRKKDGTRALRWSKNHLAWQYALEKVNSEREKIVPNNCKAIWTGLMSKWTEFGKSWDKGIFQSPKYKKYGQISAIQRQIDGKSLNISEFIDLSWCGSPCLEKVSVVYHRKLPETSKIKQTAVVKSPSGKWLLCVFLNAPKTAFEQKFTTTGNVVGIDPGVKAALTTSDGEIIQPNSISKQSQKERKLKRIQRKLDRQTRMNNPHCFNEDGTWKRGQRISVRSKNMVESALDIANIRRYFNDAKADYYHNAAIRLLNQYDAIGIGNAKMHKLVRGVGKSKRATNLRVREHAIADFISKIKDKCNLSLTPKKVCVINESYSTQTCSVCQSRTGPTELSIRKWTCPKCNTDHERDVNSAVIIKQRTISEMKTAAAQSASGEQSPKVRRSTKVLKKQSPRSTETNNSQEVGPTFIPFASAQVMNQVSVDARILQIPVTLGVKSIEQEIQQSSPSVMMGHSQSQENIINIQHPIK